jgi:hypothetical protein
MSGSISLGDVAERTAVLAVAGNRCERAGRYKLDTLIARYGADVGIPDLLRLRIRLSGKPHPAMTPTVAGFFLAPPRPVFPQYGVTHLGE